MDSQKPFEVHPIQESDRAWVADFIRRQWGSPMVSRGKVFDAAALPGFIAWRRNERVGLVTYRMEADECEVGSLNSLVEDIGVGSALLDAVKDAAASAGCRRVWLITTNDNMKALRFYQKRGWTLAALYPNALEESRKIKPQISRIGMDGIPLRDEIELEFVLKKG